MVELNSTIGKESVVIQYRNINSNLEINGRMQQVLDTKKLVIKTKGRP